jgi:hypothetical protein
MHYVWHQQHTGSIAGSSAHSAVSITEAASSCQCCRYTNARSFLLNEFLEALSTDPCMELTLMQSLDQYRADSSSIRSSTVMTVLASLLPVQYSFLLSLAGPCLN